MKPTLPIKSALRADLRFFLNSLLSLVVVVGFVLLFHLN